MRILLGQGLISLRRRRKRSNNLQIEEIALWLTFKGQARRNKKLNLWKLMTSHKLRSNSPFRRNKRKRLQTKNFIASSKFEKWMRSTIESKLAAFIKIKVSP